MNPANTTDPNTIKQNNRSPLRRRAPMLVWPALLATITVVSGCGDHPASEPTLSSDDRQICYHAIRRDAMGVLETTGTGGSPRLVEIASSVVVGSSDDADEQTMQRVERYCRANGYTVNVAVHS